MSQLVITVITGTREKARPVRLPPPERWTLAAQTDAKLRLAGITEDDPALIRIREQPASVGEAGRWM